MILMEEFIMRMKKIWISCALSLWFTVIFAQAPVADFTANMDTTCVGSTIDFMDLSTNNPTSWFWDFGDGNTSGLQNPSYVYNAAGVYSVSLTVTNAFGSDNMTKAGYIAIHALPTLSFNKTDVSCTGGSDGSATALPSGTAPFIYSWSTGATQATISNLVAGFYEVTVRDDNACSVTSSTTIMEPTLLMVSLGGTDITCYDADDGSITAIASGGTPPYFYSWSTGQTTSTVTGLGPGTHGLTITDGNGCSETDSFTIVEPPQLTTAGASGSPSCFGYSDGWATVNVSGGTPPYFYSWSTGGQMDTISGLAADTFYVDVTDANGCVANDTVVVNDPAEMLVDITAINPSCGQCDGILSAQVTGGAFPYTYQWMPAVNLSSPVVYNPNVCDAGSDMMYTLMVTDVNGCFVIDSFEIVTQCDSVWPGDANYDGVADNQDMIPIGLHYGEFGLGRLGASTQWIGQVAMNWDDTLNNGVNLKHTDCDGSGTIDSDDTLAISQNYGSTHSKANIHSKGDPNDPPLYVELDTETAQSGDTVAGTIVLGSIDIPADEVYGLAFSITYDNTLVDSGSVYIDFNNSWIGTEGTDMISLRKDLFNEGKIDVGLTRIDHNTVSGQGTIGSIIITIDNLSGKQKAEGGLLKLDIQNVTMVNATGIPLPTYNLPDSVTVQAQSNQVLTLDRSDIRVYPNPAENILNLSFPDQTEKSVELTNVVGQTVYARHQVNAATYPIDISHLPEGLYILSVKTIRGEAISYKVSVVR